MACPESGFLYIFYKVDSSYSYNENYFIKFRLYSSTTGEERILDKTSWIGGLGSAPDSGSEYIHINTPIRSRHGYMIFDVSGEDLSFADKVEATNSPLSDLGNIEVWIAPNIFTDSSYMLEGEVESFDFDSHCFSNSPCPETEELIVFMYCEYSDWSPSGAFDNSSFRLYSSSGPEELSFDFDEFNLYSNHQSIEIFDVSGEDLSLYDKVEITTGIVDSDPLKFIFFTGANLSDLKVNIGETESQNLSMSCPAPVSGNFWQSFIRTQEVEG